MIGQDYFDLRSRLGTALFSLSSLVPEAGGDPDHTVILSNLVNSLKEPFVFVVVGEVNVGKSTLLNALFGAEFSRTGVMPTTDKICFFKYGPQYRVASITRTLDEIYVPADFLKDFHVVDTPGTNSIEGEHQEITERFVPMADLVIFVFSAMNPWGASAWQFLDKVHRHWMRHVIFVLQQADLRTREENTAIIEYMRQLSRQRFSREFPIFAVSGKKAFLGRTAGLDRDRLLAESGFSILEQHIARSMASSAQRVTKLANALRMAWEILGSIQKISGSRGTSRQDKRRVLNSLDSELAAQRERTLGKYSSVVEATDGDATLASEELISQVKSLFTPAFSLICLFGEKRNVAGVDGQLLSRMEPGVAKRWDQAATIAQDDVDRFSDFLGNEISEGLKVQMREELRPAPEFWEGWKKPFALKAITHLSETIGRLKLEPELAEAMKKSRHLAWAQASVLLAGITGATIFTLRRSWIEAASSLAIGLLIFLFLWIRSSKMLRRVWLDMEDRLTLARPELRKLLTEHVHREINQFYDSFHRILQPTRERLHEQEKRHTELHDQIENLTQTFTGLDRELKSMAGPG